MKKKILIGSIIAVALLTLVSFSNVVGYNSVENNPVPDLDCDGTLDWSDVEPGATVTGSFTVENIGEIDSLLDWEIESYPDWGTWTFDPDSGLGLTPEAGIVTVAVDVVAPDDPEEELEGGVVLVNSEDPDDICTIDIAIPIYKQKLIDDATPIALVFQLISKIRNHKDIENVETENDLLQIIEGDEELNSIVKQLSVEDCGCEDESTTELEFPIICWIIPIITIIPVFLAYYSEIFWIIVLVLETLWILLDCMNIPVVLV